MRHGRWMIAALLVAALPLSACSRSEVEAEEGYTNAKVEPVEGSHVSRVILTDDAVRRLGIKTAPVQPLAARAGTVVPYSAVLYDADGATWAYTNPEGLTFVRQPITVARIDGNRAVLSTGPPAGVAVVTVGAAELFGTEFEVGEE
jgi:hypothetical protein